jgi:ectoine hydroxylase-related dioxygenase (phytanoyl-CoA dioxygenase family)
MIMSLDRDGYAIVPNVLAPAALESLILLTADLVGPGKGGARNLLALAGIRALAASRELRGVVEPVLGPDCFAVRALYFDKTPDANWKVPWHQDLMIAARDHDPNAPGYRAWSAKAGIPHVEPPSKVLEQMLALRIHLDDCGPDNGPLRVIPGSHRRGRLTDEELFRHSQNPTAMCTATRGDVMAFRPLLIHASSAASAPAHRRVIHIEFAGCDLPGGLDWHERVSPTSEP